MNGTDKRSLVDAINTKYRIDLADLQQYSIVQFADHIVNATSSLKTIPVSITLQNSRVSSIGPVDELVELCEHVKNLDVSGNHLDNCNIRLLFQNLPCLQFLNISKNPFCGHFDSEDVVVRSLRTLVLNHTNASWQDTCRVLDCLPGLEELHFNFNDKINIVAGHHQWPSLKCLHYSNSGLTTCQTLHVLGHIFPKLERLVIIENPLCSFGDDLECWFPTLRFLNISKTSISEWAELEKLRQLPNLCELRMKGIPLMGSLSEIERRHHAIARLPNVSLLNGSSVCNTERNEAERAFQRYYRTKDDQPKRYIELKAVYGDMQPLADVDLSPHYFVTCKVICETKQKLLQVDTRLMVKDFKRSLQSFTGLPSNTCRLFYHDVGLNIGRVELMYGNKLLYALMVRDGDEFEIVKKFVFK